MPEERLRLSLTLEGELVDEHRLPLSELERVTGQLRSTLRSIATVLTERGPSGRGGRTQRFIEEASDLRVVASPKAGSFALELETPPPAPAHQEGLPLETGDGLAERSVLALVEGLETLDESAESLPPGFDRGVLQALVPFQTTLGRGVSQIRLETTASKEAPQEARIDQTTVTMARKLIKKPVRAQAVAEGTLQMVDFVSLECRIDRAPLPSVVCLFEEQERDHVHGAVRQYVRVAGEGEFPPDSPQPTKISVESLEVLHEPLMLESAEFWAEKDVGTLAEEQGVSPYELPVDLEADPWRDDEEVAALIDAIHGER